MELEREERDRILAGDYAALKRDEDPGEVEGERLPIQRHRAKRVPLYAPPMFSGGSRRIIGAQDVPEYWPLWIELAAPKRHWKGHWQISFTVHDQRSADRTLRAGGPPGVSQDPGLRTRQRFSAEKPRPKGEGVGKYTDESARGYGGGGDRVLDSGAVDDDELKRQRIKADERWAEHREHTASESERRRQEAHVRQELRDRLSGLNPQAQTVLLAGIQRLIRGSDGESDIAA